MIYALAPAPKPGLVSQAITWFQALPTIVVYLFIIMTFLLLVARRKKGGPLFRHVIFAMILGLLSLVVLPPSWTAKLSLLADPANRNTAEALFGAFLLLELFLLARESIKNRRGRGEIE